MVHDHYLDHQPKRGPNIVSWFLLAVFISFFLGFFAHNAIGRSPKLYLLEAAASPVATDGTPASLGAGGSAEPLW